MKELTYITIANIIKFNKFLRNKDLELSLTFTNDDNIKKINYDWRGRSQTTNVLSMAMFDEEDARLSNLVLLGDIVISTETAAREATIYQISLEDHITRLFVHGLLHIFGYDHNNDEQALIMENLETKLLKALSLKIKALTSCYWTNK